jgi:hypothetical protein
MSHPPIPSEAYEYHSGRFPFSLPTKYVEEFYEYDFGVHGAETPLNCVAAVFDLGGFTEFCAQSEEEKIPSFLAGFLFWLNQYIVILSAHPQGSRVYLKHKLPIFRKYTGDGVIFLWDATGLTAANVLPIAETCWLITNRYWRSFLPHFGSTFPNIPRILRVGVARGNVFPFAHRSDFAGHCINLASRIQHLPGISFGIAKDGLLVEPHTFSFANAITEKRCKINGLGEQAVYILRGELQEMPPELQNLWI